MPCNRENRFSLFVEIIICRDVVIGRYTYLYAHNLDVANNNILADYLNTATIYHSDFIDQATKKLSQKPTLAECKKARANLDSANVYYNKAQLVLKVTKAYTPEYTGVFSTMQASIDDNKKNIAQNTEYLNKLQAYLKKKK